MGAGYSVILADPPWQFRVWNRNTGSGRSAESHYPTMDINAICALPVADLAAENCALFLWCVWPSIIPYAEQVIKSWGFEYKTLAWCWVKSKKDRTGFATGMGYYTRANSEPCLLAIRGRMPVAVRDQLAIIYAPRGRHSEKPLEQYAKIAALYPNTKKLELFARRRIHGWHSWGNEIESDPIFQNDSIPHS